MTKIKDYSELGDRTRKAIYTVLHEKGVPTNYDGSVDRSDSDAYSHAIHIVTNCPEGHDILELRNGHEDVYFWYFVSESGLQSKFTRSKNFLDYEGDDDVEEEDTDED